MAILLFSLEPGVMRIYLNKKELQAMNYFQYFFNGCSAFATLVTIYQFMPKKAKLRVALNAYKLDTVYDLGHNIEIKCTNLNKNNVDIKQIELKVKNKIGVSEYFDNQALTPGKSMTTKFVSPPDNDFTNWLGGEPYEYRNYKEYYGELNYSATDVLKALKEELTKKNCSSKKSKIKKLIKKNININIDFPAIYTTKKVKLYVDIDDQMIDTLNATVNL